MSTPLRSILEEYYALVDANEYEKMYTLFSDDITYERPGSETIYGKDDFRRFYEKERPLSDGSHSIDQILITENTAAVKGHFSGRQNGKEVSFGFADFHVFDGKQITDRYTYTDRDTV
ncbi:nuclear transport factor 2 family protein [Natronocalculus amylovorans]|uniref:Nuclear transport factor 2 family protein n=1 Tax=Natronocalculus amylovorans TaxID=2917812 RepID=A0AAE3KA39_9EURY|nr:nuclear transport factor 2 family protein [Natronocalculus amylovorans]MCL9818080.1 nuclear transport factor 2 family protein [Natronocalculus amylovorans]NUE03925.1 nuclear transport factor 2 family protein [Halorubraceae archaeon YAN]